MGGEPRIRYLEDEIWIENVSFALFISHIGTNVVLQIGDLLLQPVGNGLLLADRVRRLGRLCIPTQT